MTQPRPTARRPISQAVAILALGVLILLIGACGSPGTPDTTPTSAPTATLNAPSPTPTPLGGAGFAVYQTDRD
ncbi:MAG TPA: hypothetical protein VMW58_09550, partial [Anaerolineae bacterium]|nr:hypothetical protein [Anaerolineae bacterium]